MNERTEAQANCLTKAQAALLDAVREHRLAKNDAVLDEVRQQMRGVCPDIDADERSFQDFRVCQAILAALEHLDARLKALEDERGKR